MNFDRFTAFLAEIAATTYPEPRTDGHTKFTRTMLAKVAPMIRHGGIALEVGCGSGPAPGWRAEQKRDAIGSTISASDLAACENAGFVVENCDQNDINQPDGYFSLVWARHVLEHSVCPMWTLREYRRVLEPGGILYVEVPSPDTSCQHEQNQNHFSVFGWKAWHFLLTKSGFDVKDAAQIDLETSVGSDRYFYFIAKKL